MDPRTPTDVRPQPQPPKVEAPKRVIPEWLRRRNAGQLPPKDLTGSVTL